MYTSAKTVLSSVAIALVIHVGCSDNPQNPVESTLEDNDPVSIPLSDVASNGPDIVCVGKVILRSSNGGPWEQSWSIDSTTPYFLNRITWTGREYIAMGEGRTLRSVDGLRWSNLNASESLFDDICWNGEKYAGYCTNCVSSGLSISCQTEMSASSDLVQWKGDFFPSVRSTRDIITWTGTEFMLLGIHRTSWIETPSIFISTNGESWVRHSIPSVESMIWDGQRLVGISDDSVFSSDNGRDWEAITGFDEGRNEMIAWSGDLYVLGASKYPYDSLEIMTSPDAIAWTCQFTTSSLYSDIRWCQNRFLSVKNSTILSSTDGLFWVEELVQ